VCIFVLSLDKHLQWRLLPDAQFVGGAKMSVRFFTSTAEKWLSKLTPATDQFNAIWIRAPPNVLTAANMNPMRLATLNTKKMKQQLMATYHK
jgi:hypothetical protein